MSESISTWLIIPQTNLHVGDESVVSFSIIDQSIQRNVTTGLPCIHSASLKGAIKEHLSGKTAKDGYLNEQAIKGIFGSTKTDRKNSQKGSAVFFDADILFIPKQHTDGNLPFIMAYQERFLTEFVARATSLGCKVTVKDIKAKVNNSESVDNFATLCDDDHLPIIARNCLDNGESKNLWYEQVLPAQSVLGTFIKTMGGNDLDVLNGKIVQIGANATIGYGYCMFIKL